MPNIAPRTTRPSIRFAAAALTVVALTTAGCASSLSPDTISDTFGCNRLLVVSGQSPTWDQLVATVLPSDLPRPFDTPGLDAPANWKQLIRERNHFAGTGETVLPAGTSIFVPRECSENEAPSTTGITITAAPAQS